MSLYGREKTKFYLRTCVSPTIEKRSVLPQQTECLVLPNWKEVMNLTTNFEGGMSCTFRSRCPDVSSCGFPD